MTSGGASLASQCLSISLHIQKQRTNLAILTDGHTMRNHIIITMNVAQKLSFSHYSSQGPSA